MNWFILTAVIMALAVCSFIAAYLTRGKRAERLFRILFLVFLALSLPAFFVWGFARNFAMPR